MRLPIAYIPSPHSGSVDLGPLQLHMYGLTLLVAILACIWLTGRRWVKLGGDWDLEYRTGAVEAAVLFAAGAPAWNGVLATVTVTTATTAQMSSNLFVMLYGTVAAMAASWRVCEEPAAGVSPFCHHTPAAKWFTLLVSMQGPRHR